MKRQAKIGIFVLLSVAGLHFAEWALAVMPAVVKSDAKWYLSGGHRSPQWDALVKAGFETWEGGNERTAVHFFKRAIGLGCRDGLVLYRMGEYFLDEGNPAGALEKYLEAAPSLEKKHPSHPASVSVLDDIAGIYYQSDRYDKALEFTLKAIEKGGENFTRDFLAGQIYRLRGETDKAIGWFEKAVALDPPALGPPGVPPVVIKFQAYVELLRLYEKKGDDEKILEIAAAILELAPAHPAALQARDKIFLRRHKEEERKRLRKITE